MSTLGDSHLHIATLAHGGGIWEAWIEFEDEPGRMSRVRARIRFLPTSESGGVEARRTGLLIIEDSFEEAIRKARSFDQRQLTGLLRSVLPEGEA